MIRSINRSHQSDIGGATHGAYNPGAAVPDAFVTTLVLFT